MSHESDLNIERLEKVAFQIAPAFRDKFDFSRNEDHAALAVLAFGTAKALIAHSDNLLKEAQLLDEAEELKQAQAEELLRSRSRPNA
jgi:hypothetical protein